MLTSRWFLSSSSAFLFFVYHRRLLSYLQLLSFSFWFSFPLTIFFLTFFFFACRHSVLSPESVMQVIVAAVILLALTVEHRRLVAAVPCPPNAVFVAHNQCACRPTLICLGSECKSIRSSTDNQHRERDGDDAQQTSLFFSEVDAVVSVDSFPMTCLDCLCAPSKTSPAKHQQLLQDLKPSFRLVQYKNNIVTREFIDQLYQQTCGSWLKLDPFNEGDNENKNTQVFETNAFPPKPLVATRWMHYPMSGDYLQATLRQHACRPPLATSDSTKRDKLSSSHSCSYALNINLNHSIQPERLGDMNIIVCCIFLPCFTSLLALPPSLY
eukprot:m.130935 g.130935  ORF g.130935 m.130935 type:complete len:325 (-) comp15734_c1_seq4:899-1873(-)